MLKLSSESLTKLKTPEIDPVDSIFIYLGHFPRKEHIPKIYVAKKEVATMLGR